MKYIITSILLLFCMIAHAQIVLDETMMNNLFNARVKTFDEFLARFNGQETFPGISPEDEKIREKNILALFDFRKDTDKKRYFEEIVEFTDSVKNMSSLLTVSDSLIYAEALCKVLWGNNHSTIKLIMKQEKLTNGFLRWSFVGVDSLFSTLKIDTEKKSAISPVENEINFMELEECINGDYRNILSYISDNRNIDQLSFMLGLIYSKQIKFIQCEQVIYHVFTIPGYYFQVSEISRKDTNAGWLISYLRKISETEKESFINTLLGKN